MATHFSIFAWKIPPRLAGYIPWGRKRVRRDLTTKQENQPVIFSILLISSRYYALYYTQAYITAVSVRSYLLVLK